MTRQRIRLQHKAAQKIQTAFRTFSARKMELRQNEQENEAAIIIQSHLKTYFERQRYLRLRSACILLQQRFRMRELAKKREISHMISIGAAITIQSRYRAYKAHRNYIALKKAVISMQSLFRMKQHRDYYLNLQKSCVNVQSKYRACIKMKVDQRYYKQLRSACILMQARYRASKLRKFEHEAFIVKRNAAVFLQSTYKGYCVRQHFNRLRSACILIQTRYRSSKLARVEHSSFLTKKRAVITLQSTFRGYKTRKELRFRSLAATAIQTSYRSFVARREFNKKRRSIELLKSFLFACVLRKEFLQMKSSAICIQRWYRRIIIRDYNRSCFLKKKKAVITIQSCFRRYIVRKVTARKNRSAVLIQSIYRMHRERVHYLKLRMICVSMQRTARNNLYLKQERLRKQQQYEYDRRSYSACMIQAAFRNYSLRRNISLRICRKIEKQNNAAFALQSYFNTFLIRSNFLKLRSSCLFVQRKYRANVLRRECQIQYENQRQAAVVLQNTFRFWMVRQQFNVENSSAVTIQCWYRMICAQRCSQLLQNLTIRTRRQFGSEKITREVLQPLFSVTNLSNMDVMWEKAFKENSAAVTIQKNVRCYQARIKYKGYISAVVSIQQRRRATVECRNAYQLYQKKKCAILILQSAIRTFLEKRHTLRAVCVIERMFITHLTRVKYLKQRSSCVLIQKWFRHKLESRRLRDQFLITQRAAITIQAWWRGVLCHQVVEKLHDAATIIQASYKSYRVRCDYHQLKQVSIIM